PQITLELPATEFTEAVFKSELQSQTHIPTLAFPLQPRILILSLLTMQQAMCLVNRLQSA
ncbi:MAG: hypothetical protein ACXWL9_04730, partial [Syntrophales bacterium]